MPSHNSSHSSDGYRAIRWQYATQVPLLAIWDAEDEIFGPDGARAFARDLKDAEIRLVPDGGHYLLESHLDTLADAMRTFLGKHAA